MFDWHNPSYIIIHSGWGGGLGGDTYGRPGSLIPGFFFLRCLTRFTWDSSASLLCTTRRLMCLLNLVVDVICTQIYPNQLVKNSHHYNLQRYKRCKREGVLILSRLFFFPLKILFFFVLFVLAGVEQELNPLWLFSRKWGKSWRSFDTILHAFSSSSSEVKAERNWVFCSHSFF